MAKEKEGHCHCQKMAVGKAFASSSLSINQAVFMERSGKARDTASSLQGDSRAAQLLMEKRHTVLSERICGFVIFCLIIVCNLQKPKAFQWLFLHSEFLYSTSK